VERLGARAGDLRRGVEPEVDQALHEERMPAAIDGLHRVLEQLARLRRSVTALLDANAPKATDATTGSSLDQARSTPIV